jgi:hypothetical protein
MQSILCVFSSSITILSRKIRACLLEIDVIRFLCFVLIVKQYLRVRTLLTQTHLSNSLVFLDRSHAMTSIRQFKLTDLLRINNV